MLARFHGCHTSPLAVIAVAVMSKSVLTLAGSAAVKTIAINRVGALDSLPRRAGRILSAGRDAPTCCC